MSASANMIMRGDDDHSNNPIAVAVDAETLVAQTQERLSRALKRHYQYESNLKPGPKSSGIYESREMAMQKTSQ